MFQLPMVNCGLDQIIVLTCGQKTNSSLTPGYNAYIIHFTSSQHVDILLSHIITRGVSILYYLGGLLFIYDKYPTSIILSC